MMPQAVRRPRWLLLLLQERRHPRPVAQDPLPSTLREALAFLCCSAITVAGAVLIAYTLGLLP